MAQSAHDATPTWGQWSARWRSLCQPTIAKYVAGVRRLRRVGRSGSSPPGRPARSQIAPRQTSNVLSPVARVPGDGGPFDRVTDRGLRVARATGSRRRRELARSLIDSSLEDHHDQRRTSRRPEHAADSDPGAATGSPRRSGLPPCGLQHTPVRRPLHDVEHSARRPRTRRGDRGDRTPRRIATVGRRRGPTGLPPARSSFLPMATTSSWPSEGSAHALADLGVAALLGLAALASFDGWDRVRRVRGRAELPCYPL